MPYLVRLVGGITVVLAGTVVFVALAEVLMLATVFIFPLFALLDAGKLGELLRPGLVIVREGTRILRGEED